MANYIKKRRQSLYFRCRYPVDVFKQTGKVELVRSLKTRDRITALRRVPLLLSYLHYYVDVFRQKRSSEDDLFLTEVAKSYRDQIKEGLITVEEAKQSYEDDVSVYFQTVHHSSANKDSLTVEQQERLSVSKDIISNPKTLLMSDALVLYQGHIYNGNRQTSVIKQTLNSKTRRIQSFFDFLTIDKKISDLTNSDAIEFVREYVDKLDLSPSTKKDYITDLSSFFIFLKTNDYIKENIFHNRQKLIRSPKNRMVDEDARSVWSYDDLITLLAFLPNHRSPNTKSLIPYVLIAMYTGMRSNEICEIEKKEVFFNDRYIFIPEGKTESSVRDVPIPDILMPLIQALYRKSSDGYLISNLKRGGEDNKRNANLVKAFSYLKKDRLKMPDNVVFHSLRHNFCSLLEQTLVPETIAKQIVGHEKQSMTFSTYSAGHYVKQMIVYMNMISYGSVIDSYARELIDIYIEDFAKL